MSAGLSIVVPAFNEAEHIGGNLRRLVQVLRKTGRRFEVVVVDDGSTDDTAKAARAAEEPEIRVLRHERNRGKGRALRTGCAEAREEVLVLLDADLEIPPEDIEPLVVRLESAGADLAVGSKYHPGASLQWPLVRRALSRTYHFVTALLFRLPLRDTQTGLKAIRRDVASELVPRLRARRFAWDLELVLLAHRAGKRFVTGPVHVQPASRASRVGLRGALQAGFDTLRIFIRDRGFAAYGPLRGWRRPETRVLVSGDDLGMSRSVNEGLLLGLETGALTSASMLMEGAAVNEAHAGLGRRAPDADVGVHLHLRFEGAVSYLLSSLSPRNLGGRRRHYVALQLRSLREAGGIEPTHVDAHRHAWFLPWVRRGVCRSLAGAHVGAMRSLRPLGPLFALGLVEGAKRLLMVAGWVCSAGVARAYGFAVPDGWTDAREAASWVRAGRVPRWARGRTIEVIGHPAVGEDDVPETERGTLDRRAETEAVLEPPLARALGDLGVRVLNFEQLASGAARW